jgi:hypothetical protein
VRFEALQLAQKPFLFGSGSAAATHTEKYRGLQRHGPYRPLALTGGPRLGFVFPTEFRDAANRLFLALKNGVGYFRGAESLLHMPITKDNVFAITGFGLSADRSEHSDAETYRDAIRNWQEKDRQDADLFVVLHRRSAHWEEDTPYYACKAALLSEGLLSQHVTVDLLENPSQFEWSAAEIALQMFVKMGGIPWVVSGSDETPSIIIGVGRSDNVDPRTGKRDRHIGFTACLQSNGPFLFSAVGTVAKTREEYLAGLTKVVADTVARVRSAQVPAYDLTLHIPKEFSREEASAVRLGISQAMASELRVAVCKVSPEESFFAINPMSATGSLPRGTAIQIGDDTYALYTEGEEESRAWEGRDPMAIRVRVYGNEPRLRQTRLLEQVLDLSQVNYRGFRSSSEPISIKYSRLMTRLLSHFATEDVRRFAQVADARRLDTRTWFL